MDWGRAASKWHWHRVKSCPTPGRATTKRLTRSSGNTLFPKRGINRGQKEAFPMKRTVTLDSIGEDVADLLSMIQTDMRVEAFERREANSVRGGITYDKFREVMDGNGAFVYAGFCGSAQCEAEIKEETKATIRVLPDEEFRSAEAPERCLKCGRPATAEALWAKAY